MAFIKRTYQFLFQRHRRKTLIVLAGLMIWYALCLPTHLFNDPTCMVLEDADGALLGARIAGDGQWRFPYNEDIPEKFIKAITTFEDKRFFKHPGIDILGFGRAMQQNIRNGRIVSGGSTLTMQTIRMSRKGKSRTVWQKLVEMILATRLEIRHSKHEIMSLYASNAPFGGNVVGLDAASWRYYGKSPNLLSWSEAATLAVLPNSPSLVHPGRNRQALIGKRNRLLDRMLANGTFDSLTCELAKTEPLPEKPHPLPRLAPHLLDRAFVEHFKQKKNSLTRLRTTLDRQLQLFAARTLRKHHNRYASNGVHNLAAIIIDVETGDVLAYVGNVFHQESDEHGHEVDVIQAPRSSGSILKPFLYAMMVDEGEILPQSLISDIPTNMYGYRPLNFHETFDGAVPARRAIIRSLNVPSVRMLQQYSTEKFHFGLQKMGFSTLYRPPTHYGLTLIVGGAETTLWDVTNAYTCMARTASKFYENNGRYNPYDWRSLNYVYGVKPKTISERKLLKSPPHISAAAAWTALETMKEVERPSSEGAWEMYSSSKKIAWKTGTSFGFRDAWAVGVTPEYAVGVWVGNADGEGRPGLTGINAAAPVLFDLFDILPVSEWFDQPYDDMVKIPVCSKSGYRALTICEQTDSLWVPSRGVEAPACPFHQTVHLDKQSVYRVHSECETPTEMVHESRFVLPPLEEFYYKSKHPDYRPLPPYREDCLSSGHLVNSRAMQLIYPKPNTKIYLPKDLDGEKTSTVFKVAHRSSDAKVYWHINDEYAGVTEIFHHLELMPEPGKHRLTLVDENGYRIEEKFEILGYKNQ